MEMDELNALINEVWLRNEGVLLKNLKKRKLQLQKQQNLSNDHKWVNMIHKFGLTQNIKDATHISKIGGPSILDLVLTPPQTEIRTLVVDPGVFGADFDHFAVEFSIDMDFKTEEKLSLVRKPTKESWNKIKEELAEHDVVKNFTKIARKTKWEMNRAPNQDEEPFNTIYLDIEEEYPNPYENPYEEVEDDIADYYMKTLLKFTRNIHPK